MTNYWGNNINKPNVYDGSVGEAPIDRQTTIQELTRLRVTHEKSLGVLLPIKVKKKALGFKTERISKINGGCIA